jgi:hypothetical protein
MIRSEDVLEKSSGVAVRVPNTDTRVYDERMERNRDRYAHLCVNCERMIKQIARWGKHIDKVTDKVQCECLGSARVCLIAGQS